MTKEARAFLIIAMLMFSIVLISVNVKGATTPIETLNYYKDASNVGKVREFIDNLKGSQTYNKFGKKLEGEYVRILEGVSKNEPIKDLKTLASAEKGLKGSIEAANPGFKMKATDADGLIGDGAVKGSAQFKANYVQKNIEVKSKTAAGTTKTEVVKPEAFETAKTNQIKVLAGGKSMVGGPYDIIKQLIWGGSEFEFGGAKHKISGYEILVQQCKNELTACIFTGIAHGATILNLNDMIFGSSENEFGGCYSEDALGGTENCETCSEDALVPCTPDRCAMMGECESEAIEGNNNVKCIPKECSEGDVKLNKIWVSWQSGEITGTRWTSFNDSSSYNPVSDSNVFSISDKVPYKLTTMTLRIETNLFSKCKYAIDEEGKAYGDLKNVLGDGKWRNEHETEIALPSEIGRGQEHSLYIECESVCGTKREAGYDEYRVEFEIEDIPETDAPVIYPIDPSEVYFYPSTLNEVKVTIPLSENGYCKYSTSKGTENLASNLSDMIEMSGAHPQYAAGTTSVKDANCVQNEKCAVTTTSKCTNCYVTLDLTKGYDEINWSTNKFGELEGLSDDIAARAAMEQELGGTTSKMFVLNLRCADWGRNGIIGDSDDNVMADTEMYIFKTAEPYNIIVEQPKGDADEKSIPISINTTRITKCRYSIDNESSWEEMKSIDDDVMAESHSTKITGVEGGKQHTLHVKCRDRVNLMQTAHQPFYVVTDISSPKIVRAYHTADFEPLLTIKTNEEGSCVYNTDKKRKCNFEFTETETTGVYGMQEGFDKTEHNALWDSSKTYYIKCQDWKGIVPAKGSCSENGIIQPYAVLEE